jgi:hypothetical protein
LARYKEVVEAFEMEEIPGVTALAFGLKSIASKLKVVEVRMDATCKHIQMKYVHKLIKGE